MKKFNALFFAAVMLIVVAFASMAGAATFLGVDDKGKVEIIKVDTSKPSNKVTWSNLPGMPEDLTPHSTDANWYKFLSIPGLVVAVSSDAGNNITDNVNSDDLRLFKVANDGSVTYYKKVLVNGLVSADNGGSVRDSGNIKGVVRVDDRRIALWSGSALTIVVDDTNAYSAPAPGGSIDVAFMYDDKLYVLVSSDGKHDAVVGPIVESGDKLTFDKWGNNLIAASLTGAIAWPGADVIGEFSSVVVEKDGSMDLYVANEKGLYRISEGTDSGIKNPNTRYNPFEQGTTEPDTGKSGGTITSVKSGCYLAMTGYDGVLYMLRQDANDMVLTKIDTNDSDTTEIELHPGTGENIIGDGIKTSWDIYYSPSDKVIAIVNHGVGAAFYEPDTENTGKYKLIVDTIANNNSGERWKTLAMVQPASDNGTTPSDNPTEKPNVITGSNLSDEEKEALLDAAGIKAEDLVSATEENASTIPGDAEAKITAALKTDDNTVNVRAVKKFTPEADGALLVKEAVNAATTHVYFVEEKVAASASLAADGDYDGEATLLNASFAEIKTGTSAYAATEKVEAGKSYTLVEATVSTKTPEDNNNNNNGTGSGSGGGCNAGFGLLSIAALAAAFKKLSERR